MNVFDLMQRRCSVRDFLPQPVEKEKLLQILDAARVAPSACNFQPWHFVVIQNKNLKTDISEKWGKAAPVIIVVCGDHRKSWRRFDGKDHCDIDIAIAVDHMTLMAAELGLGTCWVCSFDPAAVSEVLELPDYLEPIVLLPVGYPKTLSDPGRHCSLRKPLEDTVSWDGYSR